jgi:glutaredoxin
MGILMHKIVIYSMKGCAQCVQAANILKSKNIDFEVVKVDEDQEAFANMQEMGLRALPQMFLKGEAVLVHLFDYKALTKLTDEQFEALKQS